AAFDDPTHRQLYLPDTNVLLTRFLDDDGVAEVSDFMPVADIGVPHSIVRRAKAVRGDVPFVKRYAPRFDYARAAHTVERVRDGVVFPSGDTVMRLRASVPVEIDGPDAVARFMLHAGESASFIFELVITQASPCAEPDYVVDAFKATTNFWRAWAG